jgi:hypothetical protein
VDVVVADPGHRARARPAPPCRPQRTVGPGRRGSGRRGPGSPDDHLVPPGLRRPLRPGLAEPVAPAGSRSRSPAWPRRPADGLHVTLDAVLGVDDRAVFLGPGRRRQHDLACCRVPARGCRSRSGARPAPGPSRAPASPRPRRARFSPLSSRQRICGCSFRARSAMSWSNAARPVGRRGPAGQQVRRRAHVHCAQRVGLGADVVHAAALAPAVAQQTLQSGEAPRDVRDGRTVDEAGGLAVEQVDRRGQLRSGAIAGRRGDGLRRERGHRALPFGSPRLAAASSSRISPLTSTVSVPGRTCRCRVAWPAITLWR